MTEENKEELTDFEEFKKQMRAEGKEDFRKWMLCSGIERISLGAEFLSFFSDETPLKKKISEKLNTIMVLNKEIKEIIEQA